MPAIKPAYLTSIIETAQTRRKEGVEASERGDWSEAARCFVWAAEQYDRAAQADDPSFSVRAAAMRCRAAFAQRKRDALLYGDNPARFRVYRGPDGEARLRRT